MNFSEPKLVIDTIHASDDVERVRSENRKKINTLFNGAPPLSDAEAKSASLKINANFGEAPVLAQHARRQYANAFLRPGRFFSVKIPDAPLNKKQTWETIITAKLNRIIKKSRQYYELNRSKFSAVVAHGIGPVIWDTKTEWKPRFVAIEDLRIPTDTTLSLENLEWFAEHRAYTEGELAQKISAKNSVKGWNKAFVHKILKQYHEKNQVDDSDTIDWEQNPEKAAERIKQNIGYYTGAAVPTIPLWHFYFKERDKSGNEPWYLVIVPTEETKTGEDKPVDWVYQSDEPFAEDISHLLHIHFGDLNNKAPFLYHSVRSLGFLLMEPCFWMNYFRCRLLQHVIENCNPQWKITDPAGRARAQKIETFYNSVLPEGVTAVTQNERHQINPQMVNMVQAQMRQLMSEASVSYTQDINDGTKKEQTATETMAKVQSVNAMMSGLLDTAFHYETFNYQEIARRFCIEKSDDKDVKKFRKEAIRAGVDPRFLDAELWEIEPEIPMGAGNPTMEVAEAQQLLGMLPMFNPSAQEEIKHSAVTAITGDPRKAARWVPLTDDQKVSSAVRDAESIFGTMMQGVPARVREELSPIEQAQTLLGLLAGVIANISPNTNLNGIQAVAQYIGALLARMAQNPQQAQIAKEMTRQLTALMKEAQSAAQQFAQSQGGPDPELQAKVIAINETTKAKIQSKQATDAQKLSQKDIAFAADQTRKDVQTEAEIMRKQRMAEMEPKAGGE